MTAIIQSPAVQDDAVREIPVASKAMAFNLYGGREVIVFGLINTDGGCDEVVVTVAGMASMRMSIRHLLTPCELISAGCDLMTAVMLTKRLLEIFPRHKGARNNNAHKGNKQQTK